MTDELLHLIVKGRVQGVGFRWHVEEAAQQLELAGWVKNRRDGSVEVCASGSREALAALESAVRKGPPGAHISAVETGDGIKARELPRPFSVVRE